MTPFHLISERLAEHPWLYTLGAVLLLILAAWIANWLTKRVLVHGLNRALQASGLARGGELPVKLVITRLANVVPALILSAGAAAVPDLPPALVAIVHNVCSAFIVLTLALAIGAMIDIANTIYQRRPDADRKPIKGYLQVVKIAIYAIAAILMIAALIDRSPLILLSGLGAMAAVLMLIFQDTLLSLVASVQIRSNDMIRLGDWIEMPQLNADGDVIDIALHTVKVQNWDRTITTIPTKRLITDSFRNWRGMSESGGRRIQRALLIDQTSVRFLAPEERRSLHRFVLLRDYLDAKQSELEDWNARMAERGREPVNMRRLTNLGTFRAYVERYLRSHPRIHQNMTIMVRQLAPGPDGLPLQIYCFTSTTAWAEYEGIQSDIFDHMLAILPEFGLRVFQQPGSADVAALRGALAVQPEEERTHRPARGAA